MRVPFALAFVTLLLVSPVATVATVTPEATRVPTSATDGRIVAVLPNPVSDGDIGEYVLLRLPVAGNWSVTDGEVRLSLPRNASGRVLVTATPTRVPGEVTSGNTTVVRASRLALANAGERLVLRWDGRIVHRTTYENAPEGERWLPGPAGGWRPVGRQHRPVAAFGAANATLFVLPDARTVPVTTLERADRRLLVAGYTLTSPQVADALVAAVRRGVEVRVLLEAEPVGTFPAQQARRLDRLVAAGVEVRVLAGPHERFAYHHAKYAVVDDTALVLTENWKPAGVGGRSSRGWGVRVVSPALADELAELFARDARAADARPWHRYRRGRRFESVPAATGSYPARFAPATVRVDRVRLLTAPGNAQPAMVSLIDGASDRVDVVQPAIGRESDLLRACLRAARRGVTVRLLLSGAWYAVEENARLVAWLNDWADRTGTPLTARVADPGGRFEKIHAKGLLVDDEVAVVGSLNWNDHAARENREVLLALHGADAVGYYRRVFASDWRGGGSRVPLVPLIAVVVAAGTAIAAARRFEFTLAFDSTVGGAAGKRGEDESRESAGESRWR